MKNTKQRNLILTIINNSSKHLDAYGIYEKAQEFLPSISLGTIYRNLKVLEESNLIDVIYDGTEKLRYDKKVKHQHFICTKCHRIIDIYDLKFHSINTYQNNKVMNYKIILEGLCENCQKEEEKWN